MANFYNGVSSGNAKVDEMLAKGWKPYSGNFNLGYSDPELEAQLRSQGYGDLVDANPWKNLNYNKSGWQGFLGSLGFRTGFDTAVENQQFQYKEYLSNIQNLASQNKYNSEQEKAARERAAGINVDLQGIGDASESSGLAEDTNNVLPNTDDSDSAVQVANYVMTGITTAMGLAGQVGQLAQLRTAVESGKIANASGIMQFALDAVLNATPNEMPLSDDDYENMINNTATNVLNSYNGVLGRRAQKHFKQAVSSIINGLPTDKARYQEWRDRMTSRQSAFRTVTSDMYSESDDILVGISEILNKYSDRAYRKRNENESASADLAGTQIENQQKYENTIDTALAAGAENAANRQSQQADTFEADLNSVMAEITHYLKGKAEKGSWMASAALVVFSLMRMMSVNRSSTSGYNKVLGNYNNSSMSIGF